MKELYTQINASFCYSGEVKPQSSDTMLFLTVTGFVISLSGWYNPCSSLFLISLIVPVHFNQLFTETAAGCQQCVHRVTLNESNFFCNVHTIQGLLKLWTFGFQFGSYLLKCSSFDRITCPIIMFKSHFPLSDFVSSSI